MIAIGAYFGNFDRWTGIFFIHLRYNEISFDRRSPIDDSAYDRLTR